MSEAMGVPVCLWVVKAVGGVCVSLFPQRLTALREQSVVQSFSAMHQTSPQRSAHRDNFR